MPADLLPEGVTRSQHAISSLTLDTCHTLKFALQTEPPSSRELIVWRDGPKYTRPDERGKRIRDLRPGDVVIFQGKREVIVGLEIYR